MSQDINEIPKAHSAKDIEDKWYSYWLKHNLFHSEPDTSKTPYTIVIPPPNITGMLTMGHILNNTLQDILIRMKRMQGYNACWVPGTDHASIATESKVTKHLSEQGIDKFEIGREEFLKHCHVWKEKFGGIIIQQLKKLGVSCDWRRERFTMDEHYYRKVIEAFVTLYNDGKIYRGYRLVNWCPVSKSAISDEEVIPREVQGNLWYFKYPVAGTHEFITVATTRPETMLGDTGVAVNPADERYARFIGKTVVLPIVDREIPVFADEYVDMAFGTGAVKVTPAHDPNDYEMGKRHELEFINIFNEDASLNHNVPEEFRGLDRFEARKKVVNRFKESDLLEKIDAHTHNVGFSERGGVPIEPYLSEQWYMKMDTLAESALEAVRSEAIKFHPAHWTKTYEHWMSNINDWCISRQLWWGHRIPVWYCGDKQGVGCDSPIVSAVPPVSCPHCKGTNLHQDNDVLDTWASSWLWAHDVFTSEEEKRYFCPTDTLVTAPDIIFFWVARMIMAGLYFEKEIPFRDVYFTSVIRDMSGRKMSKSLGNSPDPLEVIEQFGADALRFTVIYLAPLGQDVLFDTEKCEIGRNFANKLWNAGRYLLMNTKENPIDPSLKEYRIDELDEWIQSRFQNAVRAFHAAMQKFEFNIAAKIIHGFIWNDFCDWYLELLKVKLTSDDPKQRSASLTRAIALFEESLKVLHPFMPFITEEIWHRTSERREGESISVTAFPEFNPGLIKQSVETDFEALKDIITGIRNIRGEMNIPPGKLINVHIKTSSFQATFDSYIRKLTRCDSLTTGAEIQKPPKSAAVVLKGYDIFVPLEGLVDLDAERNRLQKEISRLEGSLSGIKKKLENENFVKNAPEEVVERERQKTVDWAEKLQKLRVLLSDLS